MVLTPVHGAAKATPEQLDPAADMSRRTVLKAAAAAGATLAVAGTAAGGYRMFDTAVLHPGSGDAYDPWRHWRATPGPLGAVGAAVLAANPHNTQPWRFRLTPSTIDVEVDAARSIGSVDPFRREQHIGLGCALENLVLGCRARGLEPTVALLPDGRQGSRVAHLSLRPTTRHRNRSYDAIGRRHTDRGPYDGRPVSPEVLAGLVDDAGDSGVAVHWISDPAPRAALGVLMVDAAQALVEDDRQSRDGFAWFRKDNDAVQRHRDGLTLDAQGLSPLMLSAAKLLPASSRAAGDAFWVGQTRTVQTRTAAAYGVLTAADPDDRTTQLTAGRLLQRVHLAATAQGIALQHMNQVTERIDREKVLGRVPTFGPRLAGLLPPGAEPMVAFRVGYPTRAARPSPRRSARSVTR